mmetsp:Transcript_12977/g.19554  ORF Transcript_12977/g.19554 Transcript_12977/m.19554 type:complete len:387 (-) Transcript_12977:118-1278(-)
MKAVHEIAHFFSSTPDEDDPARDRVVMFEEGSPTDTVSLGVKGANLCELVSLGLNVPCGFVLTAKVSRMYFDDIADGRDLLSLQRVYVHINNCCMTGVKRIEKKTGKRFATTRQSIYTPMLLSVRPSAPAVLPGVLGSVLNLGINEDLVLHMARTPGMSMHFALDTYRRFLRDFGVVVRKQDPTLYRNRSAELRRREGVTRTQDLSTKALRELCDSYKSIVDPPEDPYEQLQQAVEGVYNWFLSPESFECREAKGVPKEAGLAVVIQDMVFGNMNKNSGSGVCLTRQVNLGGILSGDFLPEGEGEEVLDRYNPEVETIQDLQKQFGEAYSDLLFALRTLEEHSQQPVLFVEFTVENGRLYILETDVVKEKPRSKGRRFTLKFPFMK